MATNNGVARRCGKGGGPGRPTGGAGRRSVNRVSCPRSGFPLRPLRPPRPLSPLVINPAPAPPLAPLRAQRAHTASSVHIPARILSPALELHKHRTFNQSVTRFSLFLWGVRLCPVTPDVPAGRCPASCLPRPSLSLARPCSVSLLLGD